MRARTATAFVNPQPRPIPAKVALRLQQRGQTFCHDVGEAREPEKLYQDAQERHRQLPVGDVREKIRTKNHGGTISALWPYCFAQNRNGLAFGTYESKREAWKWRLGATE